MKNITKTLLILSSFVLLVSSCKKDDDKSRTDILIDKGCWKVTKAEGKATVADPYQDITTDYLGVSCDADDCTNFSSNNIFTLSEGASKCDPTDPDVYGAGTWTLSGDGNTITTVVGATTEIFTLESIEDNKFIVTFEVPTGIIRLTYQ